MAGAIQRRRSFLSPAVRRIILWLYTLQGWRIEGSLPEIDKFVIAGAPHSSNWDFVFFTGATAEQGIQPNFMGKHTLFESMMGNFMRDMGGIPVDRSRRANYVEQVADEFRRRDRLALVIAPEGTRTSSGEWRSGFYHIARAANVPIVPAWVSNSRKVLGFGPAIVPTARYGETLLEIARFMRSRRPEYDRYKVLEAQALRQIEESENA